MANCDCYCKANCAGLSIVASIIIGIIAGMLQFMAVISVTPAFLWVVFGIAVVYLAISLIISNYSAGSGVNRCKCATMPVFLTGILGTILTSVIFLGIEFAATSVIGAIIVGLLLAFFALIIITTVCLIKCQMRCYED